MTGFKQGWAPRGSRFAAILDTGLALWGSTLAIHHWTRAEFWLMGGFFGLLAVWEWYAYLHREQK
jgi:hypothetical protein